MPAPTRLIDAIRLRNLLSFGPQTPEIRLNGLNVLIGPNGSGKSNFIEALGLLQAAPRDLAAPIRGKGHGGIQEWLWKGGGEPRPAAEIDVTLQSPFWRQMPLRHRISFSTGNQRMELKDEVVELAEKEGPQHEDVYIFYRYLAGKPVLNVCIPPDKEAEGEDRHPKRGLRHFPGDDLPTDQSILSQKRGKYEYPELTFIGEQYSNLKLYREWNLGRNTAPRGSQPTDTPNDFLEEDASNLVMVLNALEYHAETREILLERLRDFHSGFSRFSFRIQMSEVQLFLEESINGASHPIPATRLSDGTLRYLCLLAVLCHPKPPPLVCIEEPEIGLHPDILPTIADLLVQASQRTQLIVTTHSDILVDALREVPESILICEKVDGATRLTRPDPKRLKEWMREYSLGELWLDGELGANRW